MKVTNRTSYPLIAFGWHLQKGYGEDVAVAPGASVEVSGPYLGDMKGEPCYIHLAGSITCQEGSDDGNGFQVACGKQLSLRGHSTESGITIRHHSEDRKILLPGKEEAKQALSNMYTPAEVDIWVEAFCRNDFDLYRRATSRKCSAEERAADPKLDTVCAAYERREQLVHEINTGVRLSSGEVNVRA